MKKSALNTSYVLLSVRCHTLNLDTHPWFDHLATAWRIMGLSKYKTLIRVTNNYKYTYLI